MKNLAMLSLAVVVAAAAHAEAGPEEYNLQNRQNAVAASGSLTRAEVMAEYARAAAAGEIQYGEGGSAFILNQQAGSPRDVGAVRAEAIEAARSHPQDVV